MGIFSKITGLVRKVFPVADVVAEVIEVAIAKPDEKQIAEVGERLYLPGERPTAGHYGCCEGPSLRIRTKRDGSLDIVYVETGKALPAGWFRGDVYRRVTFVDEAMR